MSIEYDLHSHTKYSDGSDMKKMIKAAETTGIKGIGFTDHYILSQDNYGRREKFNLGETYKKRRKDIQKYRKKSDLEIFEAVEINYIPSDEQKIKQFLETANFDYSIGSVHIAHGYDFTKHKLFKNMSKKQKEKAIDSYYERLIKMIKTDIFDIIGHIDLPERIDELRDLTKKDHYKKVSSAIVKSNSIPEINAGRVFSSYGKIHPNPDYIKIFTDKNIPFTIGSDSHTPKQIKKRNEYLSIYYQTKKSK